MLSYLLIIEWCKQAGLFSAVLTAFNIELYKALQADPTQMTVFILTQMSRQLNSFTVNTGFVNSTQPFIITPPTFQPSNSSIRINILWFCSLVCSLVTASVAMLIKQWLREYQSQENFSPRSRSRIRYWRNGGLIQFRVLEVAAFLPILLQLALVLFFAGLCLFLQDLHPAVGWVVTALIIVWLVLYISTTLSPAFSSRCPYKTPLIKEPLQSVQRRFYRWRKRNTLVTTRADSRDERQLRTDQSLDVPTLVAADATLLDDEFLRKTIRTCLAESDGNDVSRCVQEIISNRAGTLVPSLENVHVANLLKLSSLARSAVVHILLDTLDREIDGRQRDQRKAEWLPWMRGSLICVGSALLPVYPAGINTKDGPQLDQRRAGSVVTKLLSLNEEVAQGALEILAFSPYQRLPASFTIPQITTNQGELLKAFLHSCFIDDVLLVMTNLIAGSRSCLNARKVDPTQLCQVVLYLSTHFHDDSLREHWYHLSKLLTELAAAITEKRVQETDYPYTTRYTAQLCLDYSRKLNFKHRDLAGPDLLEVLTRLVNASRALALEAE